MLPLLLAVVLDSPPVFHGSKLAAVPGPQAPHGPDLALGPGLSPIELGMRVRARRMGALPAVAVPALPCVIEDTVEFSSGWKAYRVEAPAGATVKVRLRGDHEAWYRMRAVGRWGTLEQGMLQNRIHTGNPEASYINPKAAPSTFFFVVDTTEISASQEPYRLELSLK